MLDEPGYNEIKRKLNIDPSRLTEELVELPQYQQDAAEGAAEAQRIRDDAKDNLEFVKANASAARRYPDPGTKQPSETLIASEILMEVDVQNAMQALRDAEYDMALWKSLADSTKSKYNAMSKISELIASGYTTPTSVMSNRRTKINEQRQRLKGA